MIKEIINKAKKHPLLAFGWTVFTLCLAYLVNQEITFPDRADYFEKARIEISVSQMEYDRALKIIDVYRDANKKMSLSTEDIRSLIDNRFPNITEQDTKQVRAVLSDERRELSKVLVLLRNARFDNASFSDLARTLEDDAVYTDKFISKRIEFLDLISNDFNKAKEMRPSLEIGIDEERKLLEIASREPLIEYSLERARQEFNAKLKTAQRKESLYKLQSKFAIAAWTYIGAFVGGWAMYLYSAIRRKKRTKYST